MTLRSRRKRQITVRNTPKASLRRNILLHRSTVAGRAASVVLIGVAFAALFAMLASTATAASSGDRSVRYASGQNGSKLKWLPYRPSARAIRVAEQERTRKIKWVSYQDGASGSPYDDVATPQPPASAPAAQPTKEVDKHKWSSDYKSYQSTPTDPSSKPSTDKSMPLSGLNSMSKDREKYGDYEVPVPTEKKEGLFRHINDCPAEHDFKPINELTDKVAIDKGDYPKECKLPWRVYEPRDWNDTLFTWKASGLCHNPLYFQDVQLERYGHSWGPYIQPLISQGHFFVTLPILPYKMGLNPPRECIYSLGYYRPGNCAPYMIDPFPLSIRAGFVETATVLGAVYLLP